MKLIDASYLKNNGKYADIIKYKDKVVWRRLGQKFDGPGVILRYTASSSTAVPSIQYDFINRPPYETIITGSGPYLYEIVSNDISILPVGIDFRRTGSSVDIYDALLTIDYICNIENITNMKEMFKDCSNLTIINLSNLNTSNVTTMAQMFYNCNALTSLDLSNFNTSNVTGMPAMFRDCFSLIKVDLSSFNTSNVTNMSTMFYGCSNLTSLDLSHFNTSKVTNMVHMFEGCSNLTKLDLSNWNTIGITDNNLYMQDIFKDCTSLHTLRLDNCKIYTIRDIIESSNFPTNAIDGVTRTIYCKQANAGSLTPPTNWVFSYID